MAAAAAATTTPETATLDENEYLLGIAVAGWLPDPPLTHVFDLTRLDQFLHADVLAPYPFVKFVKTAAELATDGGYINCTSVDLIYRYGHRTCWDLGFLRKQIGFVLGRVGWAALSPDEQRACCRLLLATPAQALEHYTPDEMIAHTRKLNEAMKPCRKARIAHISSELRACLAPADYNTVMTEVLSSQPSIKEMYEDFGRLGTVEDNGGSGILDYVQERAGGPWETAGSGLRGKPYVPLFKYATMAEFADAIEHVLRWGIKSDAWDPAVNGRIPV